jgi:hypothetical protein
MTPRQELTGAPFAMSLAPGAAMQGTINLTDDYPGMLNIHNAGNGSGISISSWGTSGMAISGAFVPGDPGSFTVGDYGLLIEFVQHGAIITSTDGTGLKLWADGATDDDWGIRSEAMDNDGVWGWSYGAEETDTGVTGRSENGYGVYGFSRNGNWGLYTPDDLYVGGSCTGCAFRYVGRNTSKLSLSPGDAVSAAGMETLTGMNAPVMQVTPSVIGQEILGVVVGRVSVTTPESVLDDVQAGPHFGPVGGAAEPGDYLVIVVQGPAQVKADPTASIQAGDMVYMGTSGVTVEASGPAIGMALDEVDTDGLVWVLVGFH